MIVALGDFLLDYALPSGHPWVKGENFFFGYLPEKTLISGSIVPARVVVLLERVPAATIGEYPDARYQPIQIWNRAIDYQTAKADAESFFQILHGAKGQDLPIRDSSETPWYAWVIDAIGGPAPIAAPNDQNLFEFSSNYVIKASKPDLS